MDLHMRRHCACHHTGSWISQVVIRVAPKPTQDIRHKKHHTSNHWNTCRSTVIKTWTCDTLWWVTRHGVTIQLVSTENQAHTQCCRHPTTSQVKSYKSQASSREVILPLLTVTHPYFWTSNRITIQMMQTVMSNAVTAMYQDRTHWLHHPAAEQCLPHMVLCWGPNECQAMAGAQTLCIHPTLIAM
jgi:hypothetical protein